MSGFLEGRGAQQASAVVLSPPVSTPNTGGGGDQQQQQQQRQRRGRSRSRSSSPPPPEPMPEHIQFLGSGGNGNRPGNKNNGNKNKNNDSKDAARGNGVVVVGASPSSSTLPAHLLSDDGRGGGGGGELYLSKSLEEEEDDDLVRAMMMRGSSSCSTMQGSMRSSVSTLSMSPNKSKKANVVVPQTASSSFGGSLLYANILDDDDDDDGSGSSGNGGGRRRYYAEQEKEEEKTEIVPVETDSVPGSSKRPAPGSSRRGGGSGGAAKKKAAPAPSAIALASSPSSSSNLSRRQSRRSSGPVDLDSSLESDSSDSDCDYRGGPVDLDELSLDSSSSSSSSEGGGDGGAFHRSGPIDLDDLVDSDGGGGVDDEPRARVVRSRPVLADVSVRPQSSRVVRSTGKDNEPEEAASPAAEDDNKLRPPIISNPQDESESVSHTNRPDVDGEEEEDDDDDGSMEIVAPPSSTNSDPSLEMFPEGSEQNRRDEACAVAANDTFEEDEHKDDDDDDDEAFENADIYEDYSIGSLEEERDEIFAVVDAVPPPLPPVEDKAGNEPGKVELDPADNSVYLSVYNSDEDSDKSRSSSSSIDLVQTPPGQSRKEDGTGEAQPLQSISNEDSVSDRADGTDGSMSFDLGARANPDPTQEQDQSPPTSMSVDQGEQTQGGVDGAEGSLSMSLGDTKSRMSNGQQEQQQEAKPEDSLSIDLGESTSRLPSQQRVQEQQPDDPEDSLSINLGESTSRMPSQQQAQEQQQDESSEASLSIDLGESTSRMPSQQPESDNTTQEQKGEKSESSLSIDLGESTSRMPSQQQESDSSTQEKEEERSEGSLSIDLGRSTSRMPSQQQEDRDHSAGSPVVSESSGPAGAFRSNAPQNDSEDSASVNLMGSTDRTAEEHPSGGTKIEDSISVDLVPSGDQHKPQQGVANESTEDSLSVGLMSSSVPDPAVEIEGSFSLVGPPESTVAAGEGSAEGSLTIGLTGVKEASKLDDVGSSSAIVDDHEDESSIRIEGDIEGAGGTGVGSDEADSITDFILAESGPTDDVVEPANDRKGPGMGSLTEFFSQESKPQSDDHTRRSSLMTNARRFREKRESVQQDSLFALSVPNDAVSLGNISTAESLGLLDESDDSAGEEENDMPEPVVDSEIQTNHSESIRVLSEIESHRRSWATEELEALKQEWLSHKDLASSMVQETNWIEASLLSSLKSTKVYLSSLKAICGDSFLDKNSNIVDDLKASSDLAKERDKNDDVEAGESSATKPVFDALHSTVERYNDVLPTLESEIEAMTELKKEVESRAKALEKAGDKILFELKLAESKVQGEWGKLSMKSCAVSHVSMN